MGRRTVAGLIAVTISGSCGGPLPTGAEITFRFDPNSLAKATPIPGLPFWKAVTPTSAVGTEGSLFVSVLFLADSSTKTYGPIHVLVH